MWYVLCNDTTSTKWHALQIQQRIPVQHCNDSYTKLLLKCAFILITVDIVEAEIPYPLGLEIMNDDGMRIDTYGYKIIHPIDACYASLDRLGGHLFQKWNASSLTFTSTELHRIHLSLLHLSSAKTFNFLRLAGPREATAETRKTLEDIAKACATCATQRIRGTRFKVTMPKKNLAFNQDLSTDIMYLNSKPISRVFDISTGFGNASLVPGATVEDVWSTLSSIWATVYTGYPNKLRVDSGSVLTTPARHVVRTQLKYTCTHPV